MSAAFWEPVLGCLSHLWRVLGRARPPQEKAVDLGDVCDESLERPSRRGDRNGESVT